MKAMLWSFRTKVTQPGVWPGLARVSKAKRPKWMDCPSSMCRSAWAPLRREMTDWQPGSKDRSNPEPVTWSAWQWVFTAYSSRSPSSLTSWASRGAVSRTGSIRMASRDALSPRRYV